MSPPPDTTALATDPDPTVLTELEGSFALEGDDVHNDLVRCWRITPALGADDLVQLRFTRIVLERGYDKVTVRRLEEDKAVHAKVDTLYLSRKGFEVCLRTDESVPSEGFRATWATWDSQEEETADEA